MIQGPERISNPSETHPRSDSSSIPSAAVGRLTYQCNICGNTCETRLAEINREAASCPHCSSSMRMRSIIHLLSVELFGRSFPLQDFPVRTDITGIGLSDWEGYAKPLAQKLNYRNTFYHSEPMLDIVNIDETLEGTLDFLICSDVLEHVPPPVSAAFTNMYRLLKPSGVVIFTVPYAKYGNAVEHFPELYRFEIEKRGERYILRNTTSDGREQIFDNLVFHGGPGTTVEMRLFSETSLLEEFERAGFHYVTFCGEPCFDYGIYWNIPCFPITARKSPLFISDVQSFALPEVTDGITHKFDRVIEHAIAIEISGWAHIMGDSAEGSRIFVVLDSGNKNYIYSTQPIRRPDVTSNFGATNLDDSGFKAFIPKVGIEKGEYRAGLLILKGDRHAFQLTPTIVKVGEEIDKRDAEIESLSAELEEKERQLLSLEGDNLRLNAELQMMKHSFTWRLVMAFHRSVVERLLHRGTRRRRWYEQAIEYLAGVAGREGIVAADQLSHYTRSDPKSLDIERATSFPYEPVFSIVVPVYNTREEFLYDMIESVRSQTYSRWELCIADGGSTEPHVRKVLEAAARVDERIKVTFQAENRGISGNSNGALTLATGAYIALLDHDDALSPSALFEVAKAINVNPEVEFLYSDYAITDAGNRVHRAIFCPDFCRFFYLSHPYIVHLTVIKKSIIDRVGGFDEADFNEGVSQDVDLFLRVFAEIRDNAVVHIPKILYFWKHYGKSSGHLFQDKVHGHTKKAITRYLASRRLDGWVEDGPVFNTFRVRFHVKNSPRVSIIIPTKDRWELLRTCIQSIEEKAGYDNYEIIVVKNNTEDKRALEYLASLGKTHAVTEYNQPFNYSAINNFGARSAGGDFFLFLNDDIEFKAHGTLKAVLELIQLEEVGAVGAKLLYRDDTIQHAGVIIGFRGAAEHWHKFVPAYISRNLPEPGYISSLVSVREYSAVTGAFLITRRKVFEEVAGFSEELEVGFNDIDFCLKTISKGYRVLYTPYALAYHHESASRRDPANEDLMSHPKDRQVFLRKWAETLRRGDPCYNPNLDPHSFSPLPRKESLR